MKPNESQARRVVCLVFVYAWARLYRFHLSDPYVVFMTVFYRVHLPCSVVGCHAQSNRTKIEQTLIKALFKDYDSEGRPVLNLSEPVFVKFGLAYSNLHSLVSNTW